MRIPYFVTSPLEGEVASRLREAGEGVATSQDEAARLRHILKFG
jgi:hypothetical protein